MRVLGFILIALILLSGCVEKSSRAIINFNDNWLFNLDDNDDYASITYDDGDWRVLNLPHDWSIEGNFSEHHPATAGGGALPGGIGWYRKHFKLDPDDKEKKIFVEFDGIYMCSDIYVNGKHVGYRSEEHTSEL